MTAERIWGDKDKPDYYTYLECLKYETHNKYIVSGERLYLFDGKEAGDEDIFFAETNQDGTISVRLKFYNGGCCLSEAVDYALEGMEVKP